jgi:hypothetical protein
MTVVGQDLGSPPKGRMLRQDQFMYKAKHSHHRLLDPTETSGLTAHVVDGLLSRVGRTEPQQVSTAADRT